MTISPVSYSRYQNASNIKKNNSIHYNSQNLENQVAFRGLENATKRIVNNNTAKTIGLGGLGALVVSTMALLGIKTPEEKALNKLLNSENILENTKKDKKEYKKLLNIYSQNPQLFTELFKEKLNIEHYDCHHDRIDKVQPMYRFDDIIAIFEINETNPSLTPLAKKALGGRYDKGCMVADDYTNIRTEIKNAILNEPEKVEKIMKDLEKTKVFNDYGMWEDYYTLTTLSKALKEQ